MARRQNPGLGSGRIVRSAVEKAGLALLWIHRLHRSAGRSLSAFVLDRYGHLLDEPAATATAVWVGRAWWG